MKSMDAKRWAIVSEHLGRLLDLSQAERNTYLDALAESDSDSVEELKCLLAGGERDEFSAFLAVSPAGNVPPSKAHPMIGRQVGAYVVEAEIGAGGMGTVWRARRADGRFEGQVAIKFLHPAWLGKHGEQRFQLEGQMLGRLNHPGIARLIDAGVLDGHQPYLVIEFVDGVPIDDYCRSRALTIEQRLVLFLEVLAAVAHAHSHLVVHRDLKPSNILVAHGGKARLLDFGIGKLIEQDAAEFTRSGALALTPLYAAPEQVTGQAITTATDVYALGLTLYLLLSGRHPLTASLPAGKQRTGADLIKAILDEVPPRLSVSQAGSAALPGLLGGDLDNILAKALKKEPAERYGSIAAFADDLCRLLAHQPVLARPDTVTYRMAKFALRNRGAVISGLLVALGLIATSSFALVQMVAARQQRDAARSELQRAEAADDFSRLLLDEIGVAGRPVSRDQMLDRGVQLLDARYGGDREFVADMLVRLASRYWDAERNDVAIALAIRAVELARQSGDPSLLAVALCEAVQQELQAVDAPHISGWMQEAGKLMAGLEEIPLRLQVSCALARSGLAQISGKWDTAIAELKGAQTRLVAEGIQTGSRYTLVLSELGGIYNVLGRYADFYQTEIAVGEALDRGGRKGTVMRGSIHSNTAVALVHMGEPLAAMAELEASRDRVDGRVQDSDLPIPNRCVWAWALRRLGRLQQAQAIIAGAADALIKAENLQLGAYTLLHDAAVRLDLVGPDAARPLVQRAITLMAPAPAANADVLAQAHALLADIDTQAGRAAEARPRIENFLRSAGYPQDRAIVILEPTLESAARTALALGDLAAAEAYATDALAIAEKSARGRVSSADVGEVLTILAQLRMAARRPDAARPLLERAVASFSNGLGREAPRTRVARELLVAVTAATPRA